MTQSIRRVAFVLLTLFVIAGVGVTAQRGRGGMRGGAMDPAASADMAVFHELFDHRESITRTVTRRPYGVEAVTESTDPAVAALIRTHVDAMSARLREARPIHQRDPLFREIFAHASAISMRVEPTEHGVRIVETATDPWVVKLIQAHADVITAFIRNGQAEAMKNHPLPDRGGNEGR